MEIGLNYIIDWSETLSNHFKNHNKTEAMQPWVERYHFPPQLAEFLNQYRNVNIATSKVLFFQNVFRLT